jgi:hypothetical protein
MAVISVLAGLENHACDRNPEALEKQFGAMSFSWFDAFFVIWSLFNVLAWERVSVDIVRSSKNLGTGGLLPVWWTPT